MIRIKNNKGFHLKFDNGLTISVQIGVGNYCNNKDYTKIIDFERTQITVECYDAEIAIWDEENTWFSFDGGDIVKGWVTTQEIGIWIDKVRRAKNIKTIKRIKP